MAFVVDASLVAAWLLPDESRAETDAILDRLADEPAIAPDLLMHDARNILAMAAATPRSWRRSRGAIA